MWTGEVLSAELYGSNRWTVSYFTEADGATQSAFAMKPLGDVCFERRGSSDPQLMGDLSIVYLGLENVRGLTGELVDFSMRPAISIKSRSKIFQPNDVLYGRLRPELNKVYLAQGQVVEGICSTEFIVLVPNESYILPRYLRHILASSFVAKYATKLKIGASLPRMPPRDLLGIDIPLPPLDIQKQMVLHLERLDDEVADLRSRLELLPTQTADALLTAISLGAGEVVV